MSNDTEQKIWTIPNILTFLRFLLIPVFVYFLFQESPTSRLIALALFAIASLTDLLDGYLARKLSQDSKLGRFMDPLADKFLVVTTLLAFYFLDNQISLWMVIAIISRDIVITVMRYLSIKKGVELKTSRLAKTKTAVQMTAIVLILLIFLIRSYRVDIQETFLIGHNQGKNNITIAWELLQMGLGLLSPDEAHTTNKRTLFAESIPYFIILFTTIVTVISGLRYLFRNYQVLLPPYYIFAKKRNKS